VFYRIVALFLLALCFPFVSLSPVKSGNRDELSNRQQLANSNPLNVPRVFTSDQNKQKPSLALSSGGIVPHLGASRVWLQKQEKKTAQSTRILRIYELNRVFLI